MKFTIHYSKIDWECHDCHTIVYHYTNDNTSKIFCRCGFYNSANYRYTPLCKTCKQWNHISKTKCMYCHI